MPGAFGLGEPGQARDQFAGRPLTVGEQIQQRPAMRLGHRFERVHAANIAHRLYTRQQI